MTASETWCHEYDAARPEALYRNVYVFAGIDLMKDYFKP